MSNDESRARQIEELKRSHRAARNLSPAKLAARIKEIGFACLQCGECCRGEDNSVIAFPQEIRRIMAETGLDWQEVAVPPEEGEWDRDGIFHTLEWRLKKDGDSCRFYRNEKCAIYRVRPMLCSTYPFYLDDGQLLCSECRGPGSLIESGEAERMAEKLIMRHLFEIQEAISLLEKYVDFERGEAGEKGECIVHDSEGEHAIEREWKENER